VRAYTARAVAAIAVSSDSAGMTVGLITETLRRRPGAARSFHPIHSVAAIGRLQAAVTAPHAGARGPRVGG
jgi:aminoglycoside N3'-acetyltransferase